MKTKLTINDVKIMLDNKINVFPYGGMLNLQNSFPDVFVPYVKVGDYRENLLSLLKKLGYKYVEDIHYEPGNCEILKFKTDGNFGREVYKLREKYDRYSLTVGGVIW